MSTASPPPTPVWKMEPTASPARSRRSLILFVLLGLTAVTGLFIGLLCWLSPRIESTVLPVVIVTEPTGATAPWMEEDRLALADGGFLGRPRDEWSANPSRDQIRLRFKALANAKPSQPVVVYLASPAAVDTAGGVFLLPADRIGDNPRNRLTLAELLTAFHDCPARNRLLILNLVPPAENPLYAAPVGNLSAAIFKALDETTDPGRSCIVASGPGQVPEASAELGRTAFGWYLEAGLRGEADGWAGETADGRVTVQELAAYLREKTGRWVTATRGDTQTPRLVGSGADFTIRAVAFGTGEPEKPETTFLFPDWLRAGWERNDQWQRDGKAAVALWAFKRLQASLLAAEWDYLAGKPPTAVQQELDRQVQVAEQLAAALTATQAPDPLPTLAALYPGYVSPDSATLTELRDAVRRFDARPPAPPPAPGDKPVPEPLVPPELDPLKAKPHPLLALSVFVVLSDDPEPTPVRIRALANLLATQTQTPRFAETVLIQRLATLAAQAPAIPWSSERAVLALQAERLFEASLTPEVFRWAAPAIEHVYRLKADAEAVYFAPAFAPTEKAEDRLRAAESAARRLKESADRLHAATRAWQDATQRLTGGAAAIYQGAIPFPIAEQLAETARQLGDALTPPEKPLDLDGFSSRVGELEGKIGPVRTALTDFTRSFRGDDLNKLRARAENLGAGASVVHELDVVLATPLLAAADRTVLWNARAHLNRRLADDALRSDATSRESISKGLSSPPAVNPREASVEPPVDTETEKKRILWTKTLYRVGGADEATLDPFVAELNKLQPDRYAFADRLRRIWVEDAPAQLAVLPPDRASRLAAVVPVVPAAAALDSPGTNPTAVALRASARDLWQWQAGRFEYESHELVGPEVTFAIAAARACRATTGTTAAPYLEVTTTSAPRMTLDLPTALLRVNVRAIGGGTKEEVELSALSPSPSWVKAVSPNEVKLDPLRQGAAELALAAGDSPVSFPTAAGVLVEARAGGRTYHRRVGVTLEDITDRLSLFIRSAPGQPPVGAREIRVRPNGVPATYQLLLANPSPRERKVVARLAGLGRETEVVVPPGKSTLLVFPAPPVVPPPPGQPGQPRAFS